MPLAMHDQKTLPKGIGVCEESLESRPGMLLTQANHAKSVCVILPKKSRTRVHTSPKILLLTCLGHTLDTSNNAALPEYKNAEWMWCTCPYMDMLARTPPSCVLLKDDWRVYTWSFRHNSSTKCYHSVSHEAGSRSLERELTCLLLNRYLPVFNRQGMF